MKPRIGRVKLDSPLGDTAPVENNKEEYRICQEDPRCNHSPPFKAKVALEALATSCQVVYELKWTCPKITDAPDEKIVFS